MRFIILGFILFLSVIPSLKASDVIKFELLPTASAMTEEEFAQKSHAVNILIDSDDTLNFKMLIPKNFKEKEFASLKNTIKATLLYGDFFHAGGPKEGGSPSYIKMTSHQIDRMISLENWFVNQALKYNYTIKGMESSEDGVTLDVFYVRLDMTGGTEIVRAKIFKIGSRYIEVSYVIPSSKWVTDRDLQIYAMNTVSLLGEVVDTPVEAVAEYSYLNTIFLKYPKSWAFRTDRTEYINQLKLFFTASDVNNFLVADMVVDIVSRKSLRDRVDETIFPVDLGLVVRDVQEDVSARGYSADTVKERKQLNVQFDTALNVTEVYDLRRSQSDDFLYENKNPITKELWLTIIKTPDENGKNFVVRMIAPSRDQDFYNWAIATKAYQYIIESLQ